MHGQKNIKPAACFGAHVAPACCADVFRLKPQPKCSAEIKMLHITRSLGQLLGAHAKLRKATVSVVMSACLSVCPSAWNSSAPTGRIFMKLGI